MSQSLINTIILAVAYLVLFGFAELLYHRFKVAAETTRKIVHVVTGIFTLFFPIIIQDKWLVLLLCASFLIILLMSFPLKILPSINAINRKSAGSILYPVIVFSCYLIYEVYDNLVFYYLPILILALSDPIAALIGKKYPWKPFKSYGHQKTLSGSLGFLGVTFLLSFLLLIFIEGTILLEAFIIGMCLALTTTFAEAISHGGYDNLTIPTSAILTLLIFEHFSILSWLV